MKNLNLEIRKIQRDEFVYIVESDTETMDNITKFKEFDLRYELK